MRGKKFVWMPLAILVALSMMAAIPVRAQIPVASVYIDPAYTLVPAGENFIVNLKVDNAFGVYAWSERISWDPSILSVVSVTEGSFLKSKITTFFVKKIFASQGYMDLAVTAVGAFNGAFGSGTLATIRFSANDVGTSPVDLSLGLFIDQLLNELPITETDGSVDVFALTAEDYVELVEKRVDNRHWEINIKGDVFTFYGKGKNLAPALPLWCRIVFTGTKEGETFTAITNSALLQPGENSPPFQTYTMILDPSMDIGTYVLQAYAEYSFLGLTYHTSELGKSLDLSFVILP